MYLVERPAGWFLVHDIPPRLQPAFDKKRLRKSLGTKSKSEAQRLRPDVEAQFRDLLADAERRLNLPMAERRETAARSKAATIMEKSAIEWRMRYLGAAPQDRARLEAAIDDAAHEHEERNAIFGHGVHSRDDPRFDAIPPTERAAHFVEIATAANVATTATIEEYLKTVAGDEKAVGQKRTALKRLAARFPAVRDINRRGVQLWVNDLATQGKKPATVDRYLSDARGYWKYLQAVGFAGEDERPFAELSKRNRSAKDRIKPFDPPDAVRVLDAARRASGVGDMLGPLVALAMHTGARREDICALRVDAVDLDNGWFDVHEAKTEAGVRRVPIHSVIAPLMRALCATSADGFVLSGLTENMNGRGDLIGKRFSRLKTAMGFGRAHRLHSFRHTVATMLRNAGASEDRVAAIMGHEYRRMTYGHYGGSLGLDALRETLEMLRYPGVDDLAGMVEPLHADP